MQPAEDPRPEAGEVAVRVVKAAAGVVPVAGGALSELVDYFWERWQQPKIEAYVEEVAREAAIQAWGDDVFGDADNGELLAAACAPRWTPTAR